MRRVGLCACFALAALAVRVSAQAGTSDDVSLHGPSAVPSAAESAPEHRPAILSPPADFIAKYPPGSQSRYLKALQYIFDRNRAPFIQANLREQELHGCTQGGVMFALAIKPDG